jgi:hypothetical protein
LHIAQWSSGVECGGDERVAQGVGPDAFGDPSRSGDAAHDPSGCVPIDPPPVGSNEGRSFAAFADQEVNGTGRPERQGDGHDFATLAQNREGAVAPLQPEGLDIRAAPRRPAAR